MGTSLLSSLMPKSTAPREPMPQYRREDFPTDDMSDRDLLVESYHNSMEARFMIEQVLRSASSSPLLSSLLPRMD
jgi:hypothetical protein